MSEHILGSPFVHVRHVMAEGGMQYTTRPATPSEIAAAHPKCETCGHFDRARSPAGLPLEWGYCGGGIASSGCEPYKDDPADLIPSITEYCPHHTELTGESDV